MNRKVVKNSVIHSLSINRPDTKRKLFKQMLGRASQYKTIAFGIVHVVIKNKIIKRTEVHKSYGTLSFCIGSK